MKIQWAAFSSSLLIMLATFLWLDASKPAKQAPPGVLRPYREVSCHGPYFSF